ncbi:MAG: flagellar biosynthesis protein FlhB [Acidobacteria bacterium]|nr:flagellar biosynthesis protein FlhB [Acidobacteriota bacterium]
MSSSAGEKTEQPTEKRLRDAKKKGQVAKSQDLSGAVLLIAAVGTIWLIGNYLGGMMLALVRDHLSSAASFKGDFTIAVAMSALTKGVLEMFWILAPLFLVVVIFALLANYLQIGSVFSTEPISPKFEKLNPAEGFKQKFLKARSYVEFAKTIIKLIITAVVAGYVMWESREDIVHLIGKSPDVAAPFTLGLVIEIGLKVGLAFLVLGALDFLLQRLLHRRDLRMTKQELKDEYKETEGDPMVKAQRRSLHREILAQSLAAAVRDADVVLANPTHLAIALKYDRGSMGAPVVTAKGADLMASQIRLIAAESGVPVKRDVPLARALYLLEVEDEIPEELYEAVATVLQWVYSVADDRGDTDRLDLSRAASPTI